MSSCAFVCRAQDREEAFETACESGKDAKGCGSVVPQQWESFNGFQRFVQEKLDGMKHEWGYWTINEGRLLCTSFSGLATPGDLTVDDKALQMCLQIGQGLEEGKSHLKVETPQHLKRFAAFLEQVSRAARHPIRCAPLRATACLREASRRGCFASHRSSSFGRRMGQEY